MDAEPVAVFFDSARDLFGLRSPNLSDDLTRQVSATCQQAGEFAVDSRLCTLSKMKICACPERHSVSVEGWPITT